MTYTSYSMLQSPCHIGILTLATIQAKVVKIGHTVGPREGALEVRIVGLEYIRGA